MKKNQKSKIKNQKLNKSEKKVVAKRKVMVGKKIVKKKTSIKRPITKKRTVSRKIVVKKKTKVNRLALDRKSKKKTRVPKKIVRKTKKTFLPLGGMAFANGIMMRTRNNMAIAMADDAGRVEVVTFRSKNIRESLRFLFMPFIRGIYFFVESIYYFLKISWHKRPFVKKNLRQKPKHERLFEQLNQYFIYAIYLLLTVGFFNYLYIRLNSGLSLSGVSALYGFLITFLYICVFMVLFFLVSIARRDELNIFAYHGAEHKIIDAYEHGDKLNLKNIEKSKLLNNRCSIAVFFWAVIILSFLITFLHISEASWLVGLLTTLGLIFVSFSFAYEIVRFTYSSGLSFLFWIFIVPPRVIQYLLTYRPDENHIKVGLIAYEEVMRMEKLDQKTI